MQAVSYKKFSLRFHKKNWRNHTPNVCQFELTFGCGLHCRHCYADCYNKARYIKRELYTQEVMFILDRVHELGVLWLCLTGGDPLTRRDFPQLYDYAKYKGFIITIFTNAYSMDKRIVGHLKKNPPFVIEITLNAATQDLYEKISQVKGSYAKAMQGISLILKAGLPLKIKTDATRDNWDELPRIKSFIEGLGFIFKPNVLLHNRLNGDTGPSKLRIPPSDAFSLIAKKGLSLDSCDLSSYSAGNLGQRRLFRCTVSSGDGISIDPYGNIFPCNCIREPHINLLNAGIEEANKKVLDWVRRRHHAGDFECGMCPLESICYNCPGRALLETGNLEGRIDWLCKLAHFTRS